MMTTDEAIKFAEYVQIMARESDVQEFYKIAEAALRAQKAMEDSVANQHPCDGCGVGWGSADSNGVKICHDECQKLREWSQRRKEQEGPKETQTNADRIRAMSDVELAKVLGNKCVCPPHPKCFGISGNCSKCWLGWLQQPEKEETT